MKAPMDRRRFLTAAGASLLAAASAKGDESMAKKGRPRQWLRAGAAVGNITPDLGVSLSGTIMQIGPARDIHDDLHVRALVLDDGATRIAIGIVDATMVSAEVFGKAKALASKHTGIPASHMLLAATHTHAAPRMIGIGTGELDRLYYDLVVRRIADAIRVACNRLAPAKIGWAVGRVPKWPKNRRWLMKPGSAGPNPFGGSDDQVLMYGSRKSKADAIRPAGPVDPELSVLSVVRGNGQPLALLANYSIHYVGGYGRARVSADYFGYFPGQMAAALGAEGLDPPFVGMLSNGTSGDTGGVGGGYARMRQVADSLAQEALRLTKTMKLHNRAPLLVREATLELGVRRPDAARLEWAKRVQGTPRRKGEHGWRDIYAREAILLSKYPPKVPVRLQAIRIGALGIAASPCETFAETGLAIKRDSPLKPTFTISLANGYHGYLPTPEQHRLGGYETWPARSSCLEVDAEPKIRAALLALLRQLAEA